LNRYNVEDGTDHLHSARRATTGARAKPRDL
jgi:hypothetical protein